MTMRLLIGRAGSGKTTLCLQEIEEELYRNQDGPSLIYLVPEQAAFEAEYALASLPGLGGTIRAQVLSFRRLAWRILQETGGGRRLFIDDTGKGMVLRKALERHKSLLQILRDAGDKPGFLQDLVNLYNELRRNRISIYHLKEAWNRETKNKGGGGLLGKKLGEVALVMEEAEQELSAHYVDAEDTLLMLALKLPQSNFARDALLWVDGFYGFTHLEFFVLESLLQHAREMTVTLCLDRCYTMGEKVDELNPFYNSAVTCKHLQQLAAARGVATTKILLPQNGCAYLPRFKNNPHLSHLEKHLHSYPTIPFCGEHYSSLPLRLVAAPGRRSEVEAVAREIIRLTRDEHYRYREIAVVAHNLEQYADLIVPVFNDYNIPLFLDQKRTILHHPLVEFIRSALEVVNGNWRPETVFRCIKSGFLFPADGDQKQFQKWRDLAAMLENYVLAYGIRGAHWKDDQRWKYFRRDTLEEEDPGPSIDEAAFLDQIDKTRRLLSGPLLQFQDKYGAASTVRERVKAVYELLETVAAGQKLLLAAEQARERGEPEKSREQEQVFQGIINLMDQLVEITGEEKVAPALFARLIDSGLAALRLGLVPPSLDQVLVGNLERTRAGNLRALFLLGANDGILPSRPTGEAIFSEEERDTLEARGFTLSPGPRRRLFDEEFFIYIALTGAKELLWVSYSLADEEGRALLPALLISRLQEMFPGLREEVPVIDKEESCSNETATNNESGAANLLLPFIIHPRQTLSHLALQLGRWKEGAVLHPLWWEVYNWYACGGGDKEDTKRLLAGIFYENTETAINEKTSCELYGSPLQASASRLERFRNCPFAHFAAYGLRLQQRVQYGLEAPDTGRFFHVALRNVARVLETQQRHWGDCKKEELLQIVSAEVTRLLPRVQQEILLSSQRYLHLAKKIEETVGRAVLYLAEQDRRSEFKPIAVEISFAKDGELPPLHLTLENGTPVNIVGRIDRLDGAISDTGSIYLRIIDYKSGAADLDLMEVLHGLSLQLFIYLDAALTNASMLPQIRELPVYPAGIFYFRVYDPLLRSRGPLTPDEIETEMLKLFKLKGKVLAEPAVVKLMDKELIFGYSNVIPVGMTKEGELYRNAKSLLTAEEFEKLHNHIRCIIADTAAEIMQGSLKISPFKLGRKKACTFCPFKAVCQFDLLLKENNFRLLGSGA